MSEDQDKYYKIASIVDDCLDDNDLTTHWFDKFLKWGIRGLEELHLDVWQEPKTCLLDVSELKTVTLPTDFVDWIKIAVQHGQYAITLGVHDDLTGLVRDSNSPTVLGLFKDHTPSGINFDSYGGYQFSNFNGTCLNYIGWGLPHK